MKDKKNISIAQEIQKTIKKLYLRINDRFPNSGLAEVCKCLHEISQEINETAQWITSPNYSIRIIIYSLLFILSLGIVYSLANAKLNVSAYGVNIVDLVQMIEAALNGIVLTGVVLGFLYVQDFYDPVANDSVNDFEVLTTGLSQKIW